MTDRKSKGGGGGENLPKNEKKEKRLWTGYQIKCMVLTAIFRFCWRAFSLSCSCCISFNWSRYVWRMTLVCCFRCSSASSYSRRLRRSILPETGKVSTVSRNVTPRRAGRSGEESSSFDSESDWNKKGEILGSRNKMGTKCKERSLVKILEKLLAIYQEWIVTNSYMKHNGRFQKKKRMLKLNFIRCTSSHN